MLESNQELQTRNILNSNQFNCVRKIGKGGFGHVLLATKATSSSTFYAIKCLSKKKMIKDPQLKKSLIQEINTMAALQHPNIVKLYKTFEGTPNITQTEIGTSQSWNIAIWAIFTPYKANSAIKYSPLKKHSTYSIKPSEALRSSIEKKQSIEILSSKISLSENQIKILGRAKLVILALPDFCKQKRIPIAELKIIWRLRSFNQCPTGKRQIFGHSEYFYTIFFLDNFPLKVLLARYRNQHLG